MLELKRDHKGASPAAFSLFARERLLQSGGPMVEIASIDETETVTSWG
jgi:hypothetical protein